jgi:hypothetical protein
MSSNPIHEALSFVRRNVETKYPFIRLVEGYALAVTSSGILGARCGIPLNCAPEFHRLFNITKALDGSASFVIENERELKIKKGDQLMGTVVCVPETQIAFMYPQSPTVGITDALIDSIKHALNYIDKDGEVLIAPGYTYGTNKAMITRYYHGLAVPVFYMPYAAAKLVSKLTAANAKSLVLHGDFISIWFENDRFAIVNTCPQGAIQGASLGIFDKFARFNPKLDAPKWVKGIRQAFPFISKRTNALTLVLDSVNADNNFSVKIESPIVTHSAQYDYDFALTCLKDAKVFDSVVESEKRPPIPLILAQGDKFQSILAGLKVSDNRTVDSMIEDDDIPF